MKTPLELALERARAYARNRGWRVGESQVLCIIPGPTHEYSRKPDTRPTRWCFKCCKHLPHEIVVLGDPPEAMSYYDPITKIECPQCREEHVLFPGREWVYPEDES